MLVEQTLFAGLTTCGVYLLTCERRMSRSVGLGNVHGTHRLDGGAKLEGADAAAREERCEVEVIVRRDDGHVYAATVSMYTGGEKRTETDAIVSCQCRGGARILPSQSRG